MGNLGLDPQRQQEFVDALKAVSVPQKRDYAFRKAVLLIFALFLVTYAGIAGWIPAWLCFVGQGAVTVVAIVIRPKRRKV